MKQRNTHFKEATIEIFFHIFISSIANSCMCRRNSDFEAHKIVILTPSALNCRRHFRHRSTVQIHCSFVWVGHCWVRKRWTDCTDNFLFVRRTLPHCGSNRSQLLMSRTEWQHRVLASSSSLMTD